LSIEDGLQLPEIPFSDVPGSDSTVDPEHIVREVPKLNVGVRTGLIVTVKLDGSAHCPASGVNV
jgi:hypothetical protein